MFFHQAVHTHLILRGAEQIVSSGVKRESSDTCLMGTHHLDTVAPGNGPHTDGVVWRCRENHGLKGERQNKCVRDEQRVDNRSYKACL